MNEFAWTLGIAITVAVIAFLWFLWKIETEKKKEEEIKKEIVEESKSEPTS